MKISGIAFLLLFFAGCCRKPLYVNLGGSTPSKKTEVKITAKDYLKSFSMCKCILLAYEKDSIYLKEGSISLLREMADDLITPKVDSLISAEAKLYVYRKRQGSVAVDIADKRLVLADCLFFSELKSTGKIIDSLLKDIHSFPDYWKNK